MISRWHGLGNGLEERWMSSRLARRTGERYENRPRRKSEETKVNLGFSRYVRRTPALTVPLLLALIGCAGRGPMMFPATPQTVVQRSDGRTERHYDTDRDGRVDFHEVLSSDGRVSVLRYDLDGDEKIDLEVDRAVAAASDDVRHLIILLDSVPFELVREAWERGRFRLFHPPSRVISPFPVMTDLCLSEFFGVSPSPGVESEYYDGRRLVSGYNGYVHGVNAHWLNCVDYHLPWIAHAFAYRKPHPWFDHELGRIQQYFYARGRGDFVGYAVGTSALGIRYGRNGHDAALVRLDRTCQQIMHKMRGRVQITLLSDHGHILMKSRRLPLSAELARRGYRVTTRLQRPDDVVVPEFGAVNCAAIYTSSPATVARDVVGVEGIDLTAYCDGGDGVIVLSRNGRARISKSEHRYRYVAERGDPLQLAPVLERLAGQGKVDRDGFVDSETWFEATVDHVYPDATHRLWRAFHGLVEYTPDVLVSVEDGWHCGSAALSNMLEMAAVHGSLNDLSSSAFVMSTVAGLPRVTRMQDLAENLRQLGVPVPRANGVPADSLASTSPQRGR